MSALEDLASAYGIDVAWTDAHGEDRRVGENSLRALLGVMGVEAGNEAEAAERLRAREAEREDGRHLIASAGQNPTLALDPTRTDAPFTLTLTDGTRHTGRLAAADDRVTLLLDLPVGHHTLEVGDRRIALAACPPRCPGPEAFGIQRVWGLGAQLYGLRRAGDDGLGDFVAAADLAAGLGGKGADFLGLNPLHALFPAQPKAVSPYAPSSRRFLNWLYIALDKAAADLGLPLPDGLPPVPTNDLIDYPQAAARKKAALEGFWDGLRGRPDDDSLKARFTAFRATMGEPLERHARFDALQEAAMAESPDAFAFWDWPEGWDDSKGRKVADFAAQHPERVGFFAFLQWLADEQLAAAQERALASDMRIGLYRDLAVGVNPAGSTVWAEPDFSLRGVSIGAPPDIFNPKGQVWGLAPFAPTALARAGFEPLIADLRANMRHAGAVRVDHVLGLKRQWWVVEGMDAGEGAYIRFPFEDIARLIALEAHQASCLVIGEDLGTVPEGFGDAMDEAGMLSCKVFWFEREEEAPKAPEAYAAGALTSLSTHDLPTLKGYWQGRDIDWRDKLDLFPEPEQAANERREREADRGRIVAALEAAGVAKPGTLDAGEEGANEALLLAVHRYLALTPSTLLMLQLEDALLDVEQANLPGTIDEHPNWRRRPSVDIDGFLADPSANALFEAMREARPRLSESNPQ